MLLAIFYRSSAASSTLLLNVIVDRLRMTSWTAGSLVTCNSAFLQFAHLVFKSKSGLSCAFYDDAVELLCRFELLRLYPAMIGIIVER